MQIIFEIQTIYGLYRDALYFPDNEPLPDDSVIEAMKQERVNNWIAQIEASQQQDPPPEDNNG